jgi:hypothetical protein
MQVIHKIPLKILNAQSQPIRDLVKILSVTVQDNELVLYFIRDKAVGHVSMVDIIIKGTGIDHPQSDVEGKQFMGTHMLDDYTFAWHVWLSVRI